MRILSALVFWMLLYFGYMTYFKLRDRFMAKNGAGGLIKSFGLITTLSVMILASAKWHFEIPARQDAQSKFYGAPIVNEVRNLEGQVFKPQAFVITEQRILVYNEDGKVYALDGIRLDGIKPEQLVVSSNITYTVYQKGGQLLFGTL